LDIHEQKGNKRWS